MPFSSERLLVTDVPAIAADGMSGDSFLLRNASATDSIDLGGETVLTGAGFELSAGESVNVEIPGGDALFAVAAAGAEVRVDVLRRV